MAGDRKRRKGRRTTTKQSRPSESRSGPHWLRWLGTLGVILALGIGVLLWQTNHPQTQPAEVNPQSTAPADATKGTLASTASESGPTGSDIAAGKQEASPSVSPARDPVLQPPAGSPEEISKLHETERMLAERILGACPDDVDAHVLLARVARYQGDSHAALTTLRQASALAPERGDLYEEMALIARDRGDPAEAIKILEEGIAQNPQAPGLHWAQADILVTQGDYNRAISLLEVEQNLSPQAPHVYYLMGQAHSLQGDLDRAQENYRRTIDLNPDHVNAHYGLGSVYLKRKQRDQAQKHLENFRRLNAQSQSHVDERDRVADVNRAKQRIARSYYLGYKILYRHGQRENAGRLLRQAAHLDPNNTIVIERQALLALEDKQYDQVVVLYEKALRLAPGRLIYYLNLSKIHLQCNRPAQAKDILDKAHQRFPKDTQVYRALIQLRLKAQMDPQRTVVLAQQVLQLQETGEHYYLLSCAHYANRELDRALIAIQAALKHAPNNPRYRGLHARLSQ